MLYKFKIINAVPINQPPVAIIAGGDVTSVAGDAVSLDGSNSTDAESTTLTYKWTLINKPAGSNADITYGTLSIDEVIPDIPGEYIVQLVVGDSIDYSDPAKITITAT
jgi:hypothetical protein